MDDVLKRLEIWCEKRGITPNEFSIMVGHKGFMAKKKYEDKPPRVEIIQDIARKFPELNVDWLITGRGDMTSRDTAHIDLPDCPPEALESLMKFLNSLRIVSDKQL